MTKGISSVKVSDLYVSAVDLKPFDFDFGEGYTEKWDVLQPSAYQNDSESDSEREEPMMNYWWPLPEADISQEDVDRLHASRFAMCIVQNLDTEEYGLALTGGGMDMSWDIAGAYILLGYLPPVHLRMPDMCRHLTPSNRVTLAAMERSYRVMVGWMESNLRDVRSLRKRMQTKA